ncbi:MAG: hemerythrin domain-containing protein [Chitinophagaceae bacterium]|nr:MAG: hemerythrin domain-containing protein [Chitinophagaceae bacterium]
MKRHPSLAHLSRDHHQALILAQLLKKGSAAYKGLPTAVEEKGEYALKLYQVDLKQHFGKEETIIRKINGITPDIDQLGDEIIKEHTELSLLFSEIKSSGDLVEHLDKIGHKLEQHIRKEERIFFPMIEKHCGEKILDEIESFLSP